MTYTFILCSNVVSFLRVIFLLALHTKRVWWCLYFMLTVCPNHFSFPAFPINRFIRVHILDQIHRVFKLYIKSEQFSGKAWCAVILFCKAFWPWHGLPLCRRGLIAADTSQPRSTRDIYNRGEHNQQKRQTTEGPLASNWCITTRTDGPDCLEAKIWWSQGQERWGTPRKSGLIKHELKL